METQGDHRELLDELPGDAGSYEYLRQDMREVLSDWDSEITKGEWDAETIGEKFSGILRRAIQQQRPVESDYIPLIQPMGTKVEKIRWLIPAWLPLGMVTVCVAEGGTGKGVLTAKVSAGVTRGQNPFDSTQIGKPGRVVMLSEQDSLKYVQRPRCIAAGADMNLMSTMHRTALQNLAQLAEECKTAGVRLIVFDQMVGGLSADRRSNSDVDVAQHMQKLDALAQETGAAILVILHTVKGGLAKLKDSTPLRDLARGSGAWIDVSRLAWMVFADVNCEDMSRVLVRGKCNLPIDWARGGLRLYGHDVPVKGGEDATVVCRVDVLEGTNREIVLSALVRQTDSDDVACLPKYKQAAAVILEYLPEDGPVLQSDVQNMLERQDFSTGTISKAIKYLHEKTKKIGKGSARNYGELGNTDQSALAIYRTG